MPAVILTETTTITTASGVADLTVTVDDNMVDTYHWNYHLANVPPTVDTRVPPDQSLQFFRLFTTPGSVHINSLSTSSDWSVYVGDTGSEAGMVQWAAGTPLLPGYAADYSFDTDPVDIIDGTAVVAGAGFAMPGQGPAKVPGEKPEIKLNVDGMTDANKNVGEGKRIRINDNFDENQQNATAYYADWDVDPVTGKDQICACDPDLVAGTLNLKSAAKNWVVNWTIDVRVNVWYQEWRQGADLGTWKLINRAVGIRGTNEAVPATIALFFEGVAIKSRTVDQTFTLDAELVVNNGNRDLRSFNQAKATVYSGIGVRDAHFSLARDQIAAATGSQLAAVDGAIWRHQAMKTVDAWQVVARDIFTPIFENAKPTIFKGVNEQLVVGDYFGSPTKDALIDPLDFAELFTADKRVGSALLVHAWYEQSLRQVEGEIDFAKAHARAIQKELLVLGVSGNRIERRSVTAGTISYEYEYSNRLILSFDVINGVKTIANARTRIRPPE